MVCDHGATAALRTVAPIGYTIPMDGPLGELMSKTNISHMRPAHIHFFVSAPGYRHLTTQINIAGDPLLHDDFAFATRDRLIPEVVRRSDPADLRAKGLDAPYAEIQFDFRLHRARPGLPSDRVPRERASGKP